jgi:hypothetical protein
VLDVDSGVGVTTASGLFVFLTAVLLLEFGVFTFGVALPHAQNREAMERAIIADMRIVLPSI